MMLKKLIKDASIQNLSEMNVPDISILGLTDNSRDIQNGYLFVAVRGYSVDGHDYIKDAVRLGASAVIGELDIGDLEVPYLQVKNSRKALGKIAKNFYGDPSKQKIMIGITGTNGKTTTSYMLHKIIKESGMACSVIGTIQHIINEKTIDSHNTTPSAIELNALLASSKDKVVIMEVSSHALVQYRLEGIEFDYGIFTNLYHDHLDYHGTMEEYFQAKALLFEKLKPNGMAIVNGDNFWGEKLHEYLKKRKVNTYVIGESKCCDLSIHDYDTATKPFVLLNDGNEIVRINLPMPGLHNLYNAAIAYAVARKMTVGKEDILLALKKFPGVPGRFEVYKDEDSPTIVIDYAHTADAIFHCLQTAKELGVERIFHIFGFRGGRDKKKRAEMVKVSSELSDVSILTLDDLNTEDYHEMKATLIDLYHKYNAENGLVIPDRTLAIQTVLKMAKKGDWVIVTGKGHESYKQDFSLPTTSDKETIQYLLDKKHGTI
ncbi:MULTISPECIES: UDP-N-acetylmuramoyl-L-alanyl-D-glutamate--2,6-diaminopimelate ligase [Peribacillus]|uniref:UDP-N-acetylmuramoyl-L-alanyl-D-glutamate--2, 6-diaminopimelate ligase n=1 Tax=Peribacillus TaxID=2675229 RepID=UPI001F4E900F|nr:MULTISPECIES: UDP-N-acetylmuramoyl-L-alanyl-D-glutamate--2,6-diaminopimelate ligase [unclassified Peribacillus]MCK1982008.1 UDP-N-acetylmuramoyl-L-alanyl-D-glutamate--2,6-diaminopimelate ligase [Peribacillus sp. Aquil_B1]MCK2007640.1 UDP-N-acetylmuramoyl-L-alanyl-D-glutamate--2,6-diaminopimelate ligase [Peribacillus sp. Aquil_B8]